MGDMEYFLGIDPGISGGLAIVNSLGELSDAVGFKNLTETDINDWMLAYPYSLAVLEKVHSMPKQGVKSTFTFGQSYGLLRGVLVANNLKREFVPPQVWQKALGCMTKGDKNVTKAKAQELFPNRKITHAIADACLIAEYARRLK